MTPRELIKSAFFLIGVADSGESIEADLEDDAYEILQRLVDTWTIERLLRYRLVDTSFNTANGDKDYTIGSAGGEDISTTRPVRIADAYINNGSADIPLGIIDKLKYNRLYTKTASGTPSMLFYDPAYPSGTIYLYKVPTSVLSVTISMEQPIVSFTSVSTDMSMPGEYILPLRWNLALELAPEHGRKNLEIVAQAAAMHKQALQAFHGLPGSKNIRDAAQPQDVKTS